MPVFIYKIAEEYDNLNEEESAKNFLRTEKELSEENLIFLIQYYKSYPKEKIDYYEKKNQGYREKFNKKISWIESVLKEKKIT